ncbi:hypothetical protein ACFFX0_04635 [Citricoccus parietis]|uniref:Uncharacterized protein n=1 Tax=Citricoccus parietis TaxID=592307 RepID=A0ABV5FV13_9MICC
MPRTAATSSSRPPRRQGSARACAPPSPWWRRAAVLPEYLDRRAPVLQQIPTPAPCASWPAVPTCASGSGPRASPGTGSGSTCWARTSGSPAWSSWRPTVPCMPSRRPAPYGRPAPDGTAPWPACNPGC